jgi:hypothetical protein
MATGPMTVPHRPSSSLLYRQLEVAWCHPGPPKAPDAGKSQEEKKSYPDGVGWERRQSAGWGGRAVPMERPGRSVLARSGGGL